MVPAPIRIVLADDHPILREGVRLMLRQLGEFELVGEAVDGDDALRVVRELKPDVLIVDLVMPGLSTMELIKKVLREQAGLHVLVLTARIEKPLVLEAFHNGAEGFVLKQAGSDELVEAIRSVVRGRNFLSAQVCREFCMNARTVVTGDAEDFLDSLSRRERTVLKLAAEGRSMPAIASELGVSSRTVESHRSNLLRKLGCTSQTDLVRLAVRKGLVNA